MLSIAVVFFGGKVIYDWYQGELVNDAWLAVGIGLLLLAVSGRTLVLLLFLRGGKDEPKPNHTGITETIKGSFGEEIHIEQLGSQSSRPVIMTHGWNLDSTVWYYQKKTLLEEARLIMWDLPGLGRSSQPADRHYSLDRFADNLKTIIDDTAERPVVLIGHSIGGMITLTCCSRYPDTIYQNVAAIVLVDTTPSMPLKTIIAAPLLRILKYPLIIPLLHLSIALSPLVWLMNWMSYFNGSAHLATWATAFSRKVSRGQLDFATRFTVKMNPAVVAKGNLAMLSWDVTASLPGIQVPVLILSGESDRITLPSASRKMLHGIPDSKLVSIPFAGHAGFLEQSKRYDEAISRFISQLPAPHITPSPANARDARSRRT